MATFEKMPMLVSRDEVHTIILAIKRVIDNIHEVRAGKVSTPEIDDKEIENLITESKMHGIDEVMLKGIVNKLAAQQDAHGANLLYLSWEEFQNTHTVLACALSRSCELVNENKQSPSLEDVRELSLISALDERFDRICSEEWK